MTDTWAEYIEIESLCRSMAAVRREREAVKHSIAEEKAGFDPDQPRIPAGRTGGGRWTRTGIGARYADAGRYLDQSVMSDASPEALIAGAQYAQTQITIHPSALLGISRIDNITVELTDILARVMELDILMSKRPLAWRMMRTMVRN